MHERVAGESLPAVGDMALDNRLGAIDALVTRQPIDRRVSRVQLLDIFPVGGKERSAQGELSAVDIPLAAQLIALVLFRRSRGVGRGERQRLCGGIERGAVIEVDAAVGLRLVYQRSAPGSFIDVLLIRRVSSLDEEKVLVLE
jgi:hypothetical protein